MQKLSSELRFGSRMLARRPLSTTTAVLVLALALAASALVASLVDSIWLRPLPYREAGRLVLAWETHPDDTEAWRVASYPAWREWSGLPELEAAAASRYWSPILDRGGEPRVLDGARVTPGFFALLGIEPALGRGFEPRDDLPGGARVVVLGHRLWQRELGGDPEVIGRTLRLDGEPATVIGVLPPDARIEEPAVFAPAEIWAPMGLDRAELRHGQRTLRALGRLAPGATLERLHRRLEEISARLARERPRTNAGWGATADFLVELALAPARPALAALVAAMAALYLLACVNVGVLLLGRATARRSEVAVRRALGAGPLGIGRQFLVEALLLVGTGAALGLVLARFSMAPVLDLGLIELPRGHEATLDARALAAVLALALATAVAFATVLTRWSSRLELPMALRAAAAGPAGRRRGPGLRALAIGEIALALVLVTVAGLMLRSYDRLRRSDAGFDAAGVIAVGLRASTSPRAARAVSARYETLVERLQDLPGVESAAVVRHLPLSGRAMSTRAVAAPRQSFEGGLRIELRGVSPGYFRTLGIPLLRGRDLPDAPGGAVAVVNESAARALWPRGDDVGQTLRIDWGSRDEREVLGVVGDVRHQGPRATARPAVYVPFGEVPHRSMTLVARTDGAPLELAPIVRDFIARDASELAVEEVLPLTAALHDSQATERGSSLAVAGLALAALLLAASGVYGVVFDSVARRRHEHGVRLALGARPEQLVRAALAEGLRIAAWGAAFGLAGALAAGRLLAGLLYDLSPADPWTLAGSALFLAVVSLVAVYLPARRAARADAMALLQCA